MSRAAGLPRRLLPLGDPATVGPRPHQPGADRADRRHPRPKPADVRRAPGARRAAGLRRPPRPQAGGPPDAQRRPGRSRPAAIPAHHRRRSPHGDPRPGAARLHADPPRSALGGRHHLHPDLGGLAVPGHPARLLLAPGGGVGDGRSPAHRAAAAGPAHGPGPPPSRRHPGSSHRPRLSIHVGGLHQGAREPRDPLQPQPPCQLLGQRGGRELLLDPQARSPVPPQLADPGRGEERHLRVHRGLLQPGAPPFDARQPEFRQTTNPTTPLCARPNRSVRQSGAGPGPLPPTRGDPGGDRRGRLRRPRPSLCQAGGALVRAGPPGDPGRQARAAGPAGPAGGGGRLRRRRLRHRRRRRRARRRRPAFRRRHPLPLRGRRRLPGDGRP